MCTVGGIADVIEAARSRQGPPREGDYYRDGLLICGKCGEPREHKIRIGDTETKVPVQCACEREAAEARKRSEDFRQKMMRINHLRTASMMPGEYRNASFKSSTSTKDNVKALKTAWAYVTRWKTMKEKNQGLLLFGPVGTGKSYTAACIANYLLEKEVPVVMTSFVKILSDIANDPSAEQTYLAAINTAELLIIDDLGAERNTDYALEKVYAIIDGRVRIGKPMILTTNLKPQEMIQTDDIRYKRIYDRIFAVCYPVQMAGKSFRLVQAAQRQEAMRRLFEEGEPG